MREYLILYALTGVVFVIVDLIWLGMVAKGFYRRNLRFILSEDVNWAAAGCFYLIYVAGILYFAVRPAIVEHFMGKAAFLGALYGFFTYATYDLTNLATIRKWPIIIVVVDILWGVCLCAFVAAVSFTIAGWLSLP